MTTEEILKVLLGEAKMATTYEDMCDVVNSVLHISSTNPSFEILVNKLCDRFNIVNPYAAKSSIDLCINELNDYFKSLLNVGVMRKFVNNADVGMLAEAVYARTTSYTISKNELMRIGQNIGFVFGPRFKSVSKIKKIIEKYA